MARDKDSSGLDDDSSTSGQSKRPPLSRHQSEPNSDLPLRLKQQQKQHHVGRRNLSSKALHKQHAYVPSAASKTNHRRQASSPTADADFLQQQQQENQQQQQQQQQQRRPQTHRRATSEAKLPRAQSATSISRTESQASLKRNRSHVEIHHRRTRSTDKLKRTSSGNAINRPKSSKGQVHFDLGSDNQDGEWVDASGSNSPLLSRKGSHNSSAQSSIRPAASANSSRPESPSEDEPDEPDEEEPSSPDRERAQRKEYLTTRLLQRTPSYGAHPQMTAETVQAQAQSPRFSPESTDPETPGTLAGSSKSNKEGLTSRFVDEPTSGITSEGSFYPTPAAAAPRRADDLPRRPMSMANLSQSHDTAEALKYIDDRDDSALVPRPASRTAQPAETSRIQQKLNLQRASSAIEPGQNVTGVGGVGENTPLIPVGSGLDGGNSRDHRMGRMLEKTGMEYLVVRRYQNPVARSLNRLGLTTAPVDKSKKPNRIGAAATNGRRPVDLPIRHNRVVSVPESKRPITPKPAPSIRTNGAGSSFDGDDDSRLNERLSGSSLVGGEDDNGTAALLRNLWDKQPDIPASGD